MSENEISAVVIREAIDLHRNFGPGLLEKVYVECLYTRLSKLGMRVEKEVPIPVLFEDVRLDCGYRADIIVEDKVLLELKAIDAIGDIHKAIVLTYLKFGRYKLGLLLNFNCLLLKDNIRRVVNNL